MCPTFLIRLKKNLYKWDFFVVCRYGVEKKSNINSSYWRLRNYIITQTEDWKKKYVNDTENLSIKLNMMQVYNCVQICMSTNIFVYQVLYCSVLEFNNDIICVEPAILITTFLHDKVKFVRTVKSLLISIIKLKATFKAWFLGKFFVYI